MFTIAKKKLGFASGKVVEAIDLRLSPEQMVQTVDGKRYFPGWLMGWLREAGEFSAMKR